MSPTLSGEEGETIEVVDRYSNNVWVGAVDDRQGAFRLDKRVASPCIQTRMDEISNSRALTIQTMITEASSSSIRGETACIALLAWSTTRGLAYVLQVNIIEVLRLLADNSWLWARLNDRTGAVPVNFIELVEVQTSQLGPLNDANGAPSTPMPKLRARALFNYGVKLKGNLNFTSGDITEVVENRGDWWDGILDGKRGKSPSNYTTFSINPAEDVVKKWVRPPYCPYYVRALYTYSATVMDELSFSAGEIIEVYDMTAAPWLEDRTRNGNSGLFPVNYTIRVMDRRTPISKVYVASPLE